MSVSASLWSTMNLSECLVKHLPGPSAREGADRHSRMRQNNTIRQDNAPRAPRNDMATTVELAA